MMYGLHLDHRLRPARAAVIAGEFAERTFRLELPRMQHALDDDLAARRDRQIDRLALGELERAPHDAARGVELALVRAKDLRSHHEQDWIDAVGRDHLAGLATLPPCLAVEP